MQSGTQTAPVSKKMWWAGAVLSALPVLALLMSAYSKFAKPPEVVEGFKHLGWDEGSGFGLGIVEIACVIIYLIPRTSVLGAILVTGYLGGAVATHARLGEQQLVVPAILGVLVWLGLYLRDTRIRALIPLRR